MGRPAGSKDPSERLASVGSASTSKTGRTRDGNQLGRRELALGPLDRAKLGVALAAVLRTSASDSRRTSNNSPVDFTSWSPIEMRLPAATRA